MLQFQLVCVMLMEESEKIFVMLKLVFVTAKIMLLETSVPIVKWDIIASQTVKVIHIYAFQARIFIITVRAPLLSALEL